MKRFLCALWLMISMSTVMAQTVSVNQFTGSAQVQIPLWQAQSIELGHGISAGYTGSGVPVASSTSRIGTGWSLQAGGFITREVRGLPDEYFNPHDPSDTRYGWLSDTTQQLYGALNLSANNCTEEANVWSNLETLGGLSDSIFFDTEPDVFYINAPGIGGKIAFDGNGNILTQPYQDILVDVIYEDSTHRIESFEITDIQGVKYLFGYPRTSEIVYHKDSSDITADGTDHLFFERKFNAYDERVIFNSVWHLLEVHSPNDDYLRFDYDSTLVHPSQILSFKIHFGNQTQEYKKILAFEDKYEHYLYDADEKIWKSIPQFSYRDINPAGAPRPLKRITSQLQQIDLVNGDRVIFQGDYKLYQSLLNKIDVSIKSPEGNFKLFKSILFDYEFLKNNTDTGDVAYSHIMLDRITHEFPNGLSSNSFSFDYYGVIHDTDSIVMPSKSSDLKDYFGFYSLKETQKDTIGLYETFVYPSETADKRISPFPLPSYTGNEIHYSGKPYAADPAVIKNGSLKTVRMPKGGSVSIDYEPNMYYDSLLGKDVYGGGIRVKMLSRYDGVDHSKDVISNYSYTSNGHSSGVLKYRPTYVYFLNHSTDTDNGTLTFNDGVYNSTLRDKLDFGRSGGPYTVYSRVTSFQHGQGEVVTHHNAGRTFHEQLKLNEGQVKIARSACYSSDFLGLNTFMPYNYYSDEPSYGEVMHSEMFHENGTKLSETFNYYALKNYGGVNVLNSLEWEYLPGENNSKVGIHRTYSEPWGEFNYMSKQVSRSYSRTNPSEYQETSSETFFHDQINLPKYSKATLADGTTSHSINKYIFDLDLTNVTNATNANVLKSMSNKRMIASPIETYQLKDSTLLMGASMGIYGYQNGYYYMKQGFYQDPGYLVDFTPVRILGGELVKDDSYRLSSTLDNVSFFGQPLDAVVKGNVKSTSVTDELGKSVLAVSRALNDEIVFLDFEEVISPHKSAYNVLKQTSQKFGHLNALLDAGNDQLTFSLQTKASNQYKFYVWAQSLVSNSLYIDYADGSASVKDTVQVAGGNDWVLLKSEVDLSALASNNISVTVTSSTTIQLDNLILIPYESGFALNEYDDFSRVRRTFDENGIVSDTEYDVNSRPVVLRDRDGSIVMVNEYSDFNWEDYEPKIEYTGLVYSDSTEFRASPIPTVGTECRWIVLDSLYSDPSNINFTSADLTSGKYKLLIDSSIEGKYLYLQVKRGGEVKGYDFIVLSNFQRNTTTCVDGVMRWDNCTSTAVLEYQCANLASPNTTVIKLTVDGYGPSEFDYEISKDRLDFYGSNSRKISELIPGNTYIVSEYIYDTAYKIYATHKTEGFTVESKEVLITVFNSSIECQSQN
ncbi:MAG: hypothetical protein NXI20_28080 [bacterium]|nr:hypothetical protein [bacterium]